MEWAERLVRIQAILRKDLHAARWWILSGVVVGLVGFLLSAQAAYNASTPSYYYPFRFTWYDGYLRSVYGLSALLTSLALALAFSWAYAGEVHRGTIRSIILYPVGVEDVLLAKIASALAVAVLTTFPIFLGFAVPFFLYGLYPAADFILVYFMSLAMGLVALTTGIGVSVVLSHYAGRMVVSPSALGILFLVFAILLTEQVVDGIGTYLLLLVGIPPGWPVSGPYVALGDFARAISVLSPQHMGARILGDLFGISSLWPDVHVVVPVFLLVVFAAHTVSRRLYPDVFVR